MSNTCSPYCKFVCRLYHVWCVFSTVFCDLGYMQYFSALQLVSQPSLCIPLFVSIVQRHSKSRLSCQSVDKEEDGQERSGREAGGQFNRWLLTCFTTTLAISDDWESWQLLIARNSLGHQQSFSSEPLCLYGKEWYTVLEAWRYWQQRRKSWLVLIPSLKNQ